MSKKIRIVVLAAGKGVRMKSELPKALMSLKGKPMVKHILEAVALSGVDERPVIIVGYGKEKVMEELGSGYDYVIQDEQLGTGHAVMSAERLLKNEAENIMVLPSDHPYVSANTLKKLAEEHLSSGDTITFATVKLPDFEDWRAGLYKNLSRIVRDKDDNIVKDVQFKDTSEEEKKITEVNPFFSCFESKWLWEKLKTLGNNNNQKEYYLTDLISVAVLEGKKIKSIEIEPYETLAANSREELAVLEKFA